MKKVIAILLTILVVGAIGFFGYQIFKHGNVEAIEIVGDVQTIYFVNSTTDANFNDADLKITYHDGSVEIKKLSKCGVSVNDFSTSVVNDGIMKVMYKSSVVKVPYSVMWTGLYYLEEQTTYNYNGTSVTKSTQGPYKAGVDNSNKDITTAKEMIYFYSDGTCDYYSRTSSTADWYLDDGQFDKKFFYEIVGNNIKVHLGDDKTYVLSASVSNDGVLSLHSVEDKYVSGYENDSSFLKSRTQRVFQHYEMKGNRTFNENNITVYSPSGAIKFKQNSTYESNGQKIYVIVTFNNDNFLKKVYVRFNTSMVSNNAGIDTSFKQSKTYDYCFYHGVCFRLEYSVV